MNSDEIKKQIHTYVDLIEDESALNILNDAAAAYVTEQPDILDILTPEQLQRLEASIEQADNGETITQEEIMKTSRTWLKKVQSNLDKKCSQ